MASLSAGASVGASPSISRVFPSIHSLFSLLAQLDQTSIRCARMPDLDAAKQTLLAELREHSLLIGEVTLASGVTAQYYVDARRALLRPAGFLAAGELIAAAAIQAGADAVG